MPPFRASPHRFPAGDLAYRQPGSTTDENNPNLRLGSDRGGLDVEVGLEAVGSLIIDLNDVVTLEAGELARVRVTRVTAAGDVVEDIHTVVGTTTGGAISAAPEAGYEDPLEAIRRVEEETERARVEAIEASRPPDSAPPPPPDETAPPPPPPPEEETAPPPPTETAPPAEETPPPAPDEGTGPQPGDTMFAEIFIEGLGWVLGVFVWDGSAWILVDIITA